MYRPIRKTHTVKNCSFEWFSTTIRFPFWKTRGRFPWNRVKGDKPKRLTFAKNEFHSPFIDFEKKQPLPFAEKSRANSLPDVLWHVRRQHSNFNNTNNACSRNNRQQLALGNNLARTLAPAEHQCSTK